MGKQRMCQKCGEPVGGSLNKLLCKKCIKSLPQCYSCGIICGATEWGYFTETTAVPCILKETGKKIFLCGSCNSQRLDNKPLILEDKTIPAEEIEAITEIKIISVKSS